MTREETVLAAVQRIHEASPAPEDWTCAAIDDRCRRHVYGSANRIQATKAYRRAGRSQTFKKLGGGSCVA